MTASAFINSNYMANDKESGKFQFNNLEDSEKQDLRNAFEHDWKTEILIRSKET